MPEPTTSTSETDLRAHVERALASQYEIGEEVGRGGMGIVYRAKDRRLKRMVAVKLLPPELAFRPDIRSRFLREAETAAQLSHPNIVPIYSVGEHENLVFFVMAFVNGDTLAKRLHAAGRLPADETRSILREVATALAYAHARGVVHRDIKPDNILLDQETGRPMVTDFGIARAVSGESSGEVTGIGAGHSRLTATGMAIGTPAYMAPEQCAGEREIDGRTDLYALGVVGYQMLTGALPFNAGSTAALLVKHLTEAPIPLTDRQADVPPDLERAIMMLLEKEPANRFPSAGALAAALETRIVPERPAGATAARLTSRTAAPPAGRHEAEEAVAFPTAEELRRWDVAAVQRFRRKFVFYGFMTPIVWLSAIIGDGAFVTLWVFWSLYMAYQYAKLWTDGYDWRDVFRQPRHRSLYDVMTETVDDVQGLLDKDKRREVMDRSRARRLASGGAASTPASPVPDLSEQAGAHAGKLQQAALDRDEIIRLIDAMPPNERSRVPEVVPSAKALFQRIQALALSLADIERNLPAGAVDGVEREIAELEAAANPLDRVGSEGRVRRLAQLKRQRRALSDIVQRREAAAGRLESCLLALQNMRFDVLRLRAGAQTHAHITSLAVEAMNLAKEIDTALYVADEMAKLGERPSLRTSGSRATERA